MDNTNCNLKKEREKEEKQQIIGDLKTKIRENNLFEKRYKKKAKICKIQPKVKKARLFSFKKINYSPLLQSNQVQLNKKYLFNKKEIFYFKPICPI